MPSPSTSGTAIRADLLDPALWQDGLATYARATNLAVALADAAGRLIGQYISPRPTWSLLRAKAPPTSPPSEGAAGGVGCPFSLVPLKPCNCVADALAGGGLVAARDRTGLMHFAVPLVLGEHPLGALVAGQVFDHYPEQLPLERVAKQLGLSPDTVWQVARLEHPVKRATLEVYADLLATLGQTLLQTRYHTILAAERTAELSQANAVLKTQIAEILQAERRLAAEHAVARVLTESTSLTDAASKIIQGISQSLGWDVGLLWTLDRDAEVLRCIEVWHSPTVAIPAFEQFSRQHSFPAGMGLPGRVWASNSPAWIPDVTRDANFQRATIAAKEGLHAGIGFPIGDGIRFLGVMEFFSLEIRQPDEELLRMMTSIGSHIGQFMERRKAERALSLKEGELCVAQKIQQGLVPQVPPALGDFEIAGVSHPTAETGGDYFDFFPLLDSSQGIVIGDASGHGLGAALVVMATRAYLRAFALTSEDIGRIIALVNTRLAEDVGDDYFVTLFLARLDPRTRSLLYTSAGHPKGCIFDPSGRVKAFMDSTGPPLGILPDGDFPIAPAITLQPGDIVLLLTDGVVEAWAPDGTAFGFQRAIDIVRVYRRDTAAQIARNLYRAVRAFSANLPQVDDITAVVIKVREAF